MSGLLELVEARCVRGESRLKAAERILIEEALAFYGGSAPRAARRLRTHYASVWRRVRKYNLDLKNREEAEKA